MLDKRQPKQKGSFAKQPLSTMESITNWQISLRALVIDIHNQNLTILSLVAIFDYL
jgi:hypothetical protein